MSKETIPTVAKLLKSARKLCTSLSTDGASINRFHSVPDLCFFTYSCDHVPPSSTTSNVIKTRNYFSIEKRTLNQERNRQNQNSFRYYACAPLRFHVSVVMPLVLHSCLNLACLTRVYVETYWSLLSYNLIRNQYCKQCKRKEKLFLLNQLKWYL